MRPALWAGAVAVEDSRLLLVRSRPPARPGWWTVPAVEVDLDEPLAAAVVRAVDEEAGLEAVAESLIGHVEQLEGEAHRVLLVFEATVLGGGTLEPAATWVEVDEVAELPLVPGLVELLVERGLLRLIA